MLVHHPPKATLCGDKNPRPAGIFGSVRTRDFDELAEAFRRWKQHFRQLGRGPFQGEIQFLQLGGIQVFRATLNRVIHVQGSPPPDSFMFVPVVARTEGARWRGRRRQAGDLNVLVPGREVDHLTSADYEIVGVTVDGSFCRESAAVLGRFDLEERLAGTIGVTSSPASCRALSAHLVGLLEHAEARPDLLTAPDAGRLVAQECIRRLVGVIAQARSNGRAECQPSIRERLVRRAEDYMRAHLLQSLSLFDLCREFGVSERTLLYAFKQVRGLSPMAYFKAVRLNAVRQELKKADIATVHEIAQRLGFWHAGEFAADYRRLFGELPSQTVGSRFGRPPRCLGIPEQPG